MSQSLPETSINLWLQSESNNLSPVTFITAKEWDGNQGAVVSVQTMNSYNGNIPVISLLWNV